MSLGYAADVASRVEEMEGLVADLGLSTVIVGLLVLGSLFLFFRSARALWVIGLPLFAGTVAAFGVVALPPLSIVSLNSNTAFLGSIVIGNGINSSIILLSRYRQERLRGRAKDQALEVAVESTYRPTLAASLAAAAAYGSLIFTSFRGFNQFGWIGAAGMMTCWLSAYTILPLLIRHFDPFARLHNEAPAISCPKSARPQSLVARLTASLLARPRLVVAIVAVGLVASIAGIYQRRGQWVEYDLSRLRRADSWENGERFWGRRLDQTLERYLTPVVIMARDGEAAASIAARIEALKSQGKAGGLISSVRTSQSVVPTHPESSIAEAKAIKALLTPHLLSRLPEASRKVLESALSEQSFVPLTPERVPPMLLTGLLDKTGQVDRNVLIFPTIAGGTWDSQRIVAFSQALRAEALAVDPTASVFGSLPLSSDIAASMTEDAPRITLLSLLVVLAVCLLAFRSFSLSVWAVASLFVGVLLTLGAYAWSGGKLNFSNFVALPITFGIAADYSINMLRRRMTDHLEDARDTVFASGGAVTLCSLTTVIGFGSLLLANNRALFSFGVVAVAGELACLVTAVIVLPTAMYLFQANRRPATPGRPATNGLGELPVHERLDESLST
jgi:predicted RND superfamily exporter protein